ncbi:MAG TPA: AI-2E family transporter [Steroidobacteraceae bacterium]|nr:AI-2E family transporter [Steroidobacteraceae bacterium]
MEELVPAPWLRRLITATLLAGLLLLGARVMEPFIVPVLWAAILGFVTWQAHERLVSACGGRRVLAALLMTVAVSLAVIAPIAWLALVLRIELVRLWHDAQALAAGGAQLPPAVLRIPWIGEQLGDLMARIAQDPHVLGFELRKITDHSFDHIARLVGGISREVVKMAFTALSLFFVYRDGRRLAAELTQALEKVLGSRIHAYLTAIEQTVKAVVYGLVLTALVQGLLVGIGYWVAGTGAPVFLAALTTVCGLIPFAAPTVWLGVCVWLLVTGSTAAAIGLAVWGAIVLGWTDHIVRPFLISREAEIPFIIVLFGVLGGLATFGLVGLFIGPVILAVLLAIWREWLLESRPPLAPGAGRRSD